MAASWGIKPPITQHAGLWEVPVYALTVPDDQVAKQYGFDYSLRDKIQQKMSWFDVQSGKIEAGDYNLFYMAGLSGPEVLAILKYNLDLRLAGNKAPMTFLGHSTQYDDQIDQWTPTVSTAAERRQAIEDFLDYALSKQDVRIGSHLELVNWMENPQALPARCESAEWMKDASYSQAKNVSYACLLYTNHYFWNFNDIHRS
ncbi:MAG: carbohydrate-binding protein, partial [Vibrio litoralis]